MILAIDPSNKTGWCTSDGNVGLLDLTPKPATKGKPAKPAKYHKRTGALLREAVPAVPGRLPESDTDRLWKLWRFMSQYATEAKWVAHEAPLRHHASQQASKCAHELQATIKLWCMVHRVYRLSIEPLELQRFVLGKKADAEANEMLHAARSRLGFTGTDDNIADALWVMEWAKALMAQQEARNP